MKIRGRLPVYDNGPPKHVHAIGVIALTYATLQSGMDRLFLNRAKSEWAEKYYYLLSEDNRPTRSRRYSRTTTRSVVEAIGNIVANISIGPEPAETSSCTQRVIRPVLFLFPMALLA